MEQVSYSDSNRGSHRGNVFLSSASYLSESVSMRSYRRAIIGILEHLQFRVYDWQQEGVSSNTVIERLKREIVNSNHMLVIIGTREGGLPPQENGVSKFQSWVHFECFYARENRVPLSVYVYNKHRPIPWQEELFKHIAYLNFAHKYDLLAKISCDFAKFAFEDIDRQINRISDGNSTQESKNSDYGQVLDSHNQNIRRDVIDEVHKLIRTQRLRLKQCYLTIIILITTLILLLWRAIYFIPIAILVLCVAIQCPYESRQGPSDTPGSNLGDSVHGYEPIASDPLSVPFDTEFDFWYCADMLRADTKRPCLEIAPQVSKGEPEASPAAEEDMVLPKQGFNVPNFEKSSP